MWPDENPPQMDQSTPPDAKTGMHGLMADLREIAQFLFQLQQADLVFDDSLVSNEHEDNLLCVLTVWFPSPSKPVGNLSFSTTECQIWSELIQLRLHS